MFTPSTALFTAASKPSLFAYSPLTAAPPAISLTSSLIPASFNDLSTSSNVGTVTDNKAETPTIFALVLFAFSAKTLGGTSIPKSILQIQLI